MDKKIKDYTREELKGIIYSDSKKLKEMYPSYRWGQAVFNYIDQYIGVARKVLINKLNFLLQNLIFLSL